MGNQVITGICSKCGQSYKGRPALSRDDRKALICPDCGVREALATLGVSEKEQKSILNAIHRGRLFHYSECVRTKMILHKLQS